MVGSSVLEMGHDMQNANDIIFLGLPSNLMHLLQALGRICRGPGDVGRALILCNATDYDGVDDNVVNLIKEKGACFQRTLYAHFGEKFTREAGEPCCDFCDPAGVDKFPMLPPCELPAVVTLAGDVSITDRAEKSAPLLKALLASAINTRPARVNAWAPAEDRSGLGAVVLGGGLERALCRDYARAFAAGLDMSRYRYDSNEHKDVVLRCISEVDTGRVAMDLD